MGNFRRLAKPFHGYLSFNRFAYLRIITPVGLDETGIIQERRAQSIDANAWSATSKAAALTIMLAPARVAAYKALARGWRPVAEVTMTI